jgi:hypothetical protein
MARYALMAACGLHALRLFCAGRCAVNYTSTPFLCLGRQRLRASASLVVSVRAVGHWYLVSRLEVDAGVPQP